MGSPVSGLQGLQQIKQLESPDSGGISLGREPTGPSFADTLADAVTGVSDAQDSARALIEGYVNRDPNILVQDVMAASEEASLSLELLVEVRNKLTEAYRSLMNMQS